MFRYHHSFGREFSAKDKKDFCYSEINDTYIENTLHKLLSDFGESNTDKQSYQISLNSEGSGYVNGASPVAPSSSSFDFADGKDTGDRSYSIASNPSLDIAELSSIQSKIAKSVKEDLDSLEKSKVESESTTPTTPTTPTTSAAE